MALVINSAQEGQRKLKAQLKKMEREISFLCDNYRKELAKPILSVTQNQENVFELLFVGILTWVLIAGLLILEFFMVSDLPNDNIAITMAIITISFELLALYSIDRIKRNNRFSGLDERTPIGLQFIKLIPIGLNLWVAQSRVESYLSNGSTLSTSLLIGGGYFLAFLSAYSLLLYMANRGQFLENLMSPFELMKEKKAIREEQQNSRNEEVLVQIRQDIISNVDTWVTGTYRYETIYNPMKQDGEPNQNFIKIYGERQQRNFVYEAYEHSLTDEDISTINSIVGQIIPQREGTQQLVGGSDIEINPPEPPQPPMGLGGGTPPPNQDFNDKKGIIV